MDGGNKKIIDARTSNIFDDSSLFPKSFKLLKLVGSSRKRMRTLDAHVLRQSPSLLTRISSRLGDSCW